MSEPIKTREEFERIIVDLPRWYHPNKDRILAYVDSLAARIKEYEAMPMKHILTFALLAEDFKAQNIRRK